MVQIYKSAPRRGRGRLKNGLLRPASAVPAVTEKRFFLHHSARFPASSRDLAAYSLSLRYAIIRHCDTQALGASALSDCYPPPMNKSAFLAEWLAAVPSEPRNDGETPLCAIVRVFPRHPGLRPGIWLASLNCFALLLRRPQRWKCVLATCTLAWIL